MAGYDAEFMETPVGGHDGRSPREFPKVVRKKHPRTQELLTKVVNDATEEAAARDDGWATTAEENHALLNSTP